MRNGAASTTSAVGARCHNENGITTTIAGLWRYGDSGVSTGCTALVLLTHWHDYMIYYINVECTTWLNQCITVYWLIRSLDSYISMLTHSIATRNYAFCTDSLKRLKQSKRQRNIHTHKMFCKQQ